MLDVVFQAFFIKLVLPFDLSWMHLIFFLTKQEKQDNVELTWLCFPKEKDMCFIR